MASKGGGDGGCSSDRAAPPRRGPRRDPAKREAAGAGLPPCWAPCGACKFLRRRCMSGCVFAPHFGSEQGAARFAAVHKVFGASNVSKLLAHVPAGRRHDAVVTICYEAQARLSDPVYGCVSTVLALQQQVASLQAELSIVQSQLINSQLAVASAIHGAQQTQHIAVLQAAYSNNSSASTAMLNLSSFTSSFEFEDITEPVSRGLDPVQLSQPSLEEEDSRNPAVFANGVLFHSK